LIVDPDTFPIDMAPEEIMEMLQYLNCIWIRRGDVQKPHAELTSGLCSNGYIDLSRILCYPLVCEILARQLSCKLVDKGVKRVDYVIGTPNTANTLAFEVAKAYNTVHAFAEKIENPIGPSKRRIVWSGMTLRRGATVLLIDETITTGGTIRALRQAIKEGNEEPVKILPTVGAIVNRPPRLPVNYGDMKVVSLLEIAIQTFKPDKCPYCRAGSPRVRPRTHWQELTGKA
jgi:orotate phosphoribosyltransferase